MFIFQSSGERMLEIINNIIDMSISQKILTPYTGFINPMLVPVKDGDGNITDIRVEYQDDFLAQMLYYGKNYSFLTYFPLFSGVPPKNTRSV